MPSLRAVLPFALLLAACADAQNPPPDRAAETTAPVASTRPAEPPVTAAPAASSAPAPTVAPVASATPPAPPEEPKVDCSKLAKGASPGPRMLCELAVAKDPAAILDEKGFAMVTQFESPGEDADPKEGKLKKRVCGDEAQRRVKDLYQSLRYDFAQVKDQKEEQISCKGMVCDVPAFGEWSTWTRLYFRPVKGKVVLDAWTRIERSLIGPDEVKKREKFLEQGLKELRNAPCPKP